MMPNGGTGTSASANVPIYVSSDHHEDTDSEIVTPEPEHEETDREQSSSEGTGHPFCAFAMLTSNQMSQMLLLLPSCVAILGRWRTTVVTVAFGILGCWTAQLLQVFCVRFFPTAKARDEIVQWDVLLSDNYGGAVKKLGMLGMGFNILCLLTRSIIQLTYAVSIIYFVEDKLDKRNWTFVWASCCVLCFALLPDLTRSKFFSVLSFVTATVAALSITIASLLHQPSQGVEHTVVSGSIKSWAWVSSTIIYAFGDGSVSAETWVVTQKEEKRGKPERVEYNITEQQFKYAFWGSVAYATLLSLVEAQISYRVFGDELAKIPPAARPSVLAVLPPSYWCDVIASISLLILQLIGISQSLSPLFMYIRRLLRLLHCGQNSGCFLHFMARTSVIGFICILAAAIPFAGSIEITSLVGSFVVSPAIYIIPAVVHMLYFFNDLHHHIQCLLSCNTNRMNDGLTVVALIAYYIMNIIQFAGVLIIVVIIGGALTSIGKVFHSHNFHRSDFWNNCYLCANLLLPSAFAPVSAPAPHTVHCLTNNSSMSNGTC